MIYFGKSKKLIRRYRIFFKFVMRRVTFDKVIPHYFIVIDFGFNRYWIGMNRFKRITKDKVYELDGVKYYRNSKGQYKRRQIL